MSGKRIDVSTLVIEIRNDKNHEDEISAITALLADKDIMAFIEAIEFQGYDPELIFSIMHAIEPTMKQLLTDALRLITFVMVRGTRWTRDRIKSSMDKETWASFNALCEKYGITENTPEKKEDINLSRVVGAFPHIAATIMKNVTQSRLVGEVPNKEIRYKPLCFPGSASLIPRTAAGDALFEKMMAYYIEFDKIVKTSDVSRASRGQAVKAPDPVAVKRYAEISRGSKILSDKMRETVLKNLGVW